METSHWKSSRKGQGEQLRHFTTLYLDHLKQPRGISPRGGPTWVADGVGTMEGPRIKTSLTFWVGGDEQEGGWIIRRLAWRSDGAPEVAPAASAVTEHILATGMSARGAAALGFEQVANLLGGVPRYREEGVTLTLQALRRALAAAGMLGPLEHPLAEGEEARFCHCMGVMASDLVRCQQLGMDLDAIRQRTGFGTGCGTCVPAVLAFLEERESG